MAIAALAPHVDVSRKLRLSTILQLWALSSQAEQFKKYVSEAKIQLTLEQCGRWEHLHSV